MKQIKIDYSPVTKLSEETQVHLQRADFCLQAIRERRPFSGKELKTISDFFRTSLTYASGAVEGCTFTMGETKTLLEYGITIHGKSLKETLEVCGLANAFDHIITLCKQPEVTINDICKLHELIYEKADEWNAGAYKTEQNFISGSDYTTIPPEKVETEMENLQLWMDANRDKLHPIIFAAEVHRKLMYIHPFADGNGRCARLVMNLILLQNGYLPCSISPAIRLEYINALEAGRGGYDTAFYNCIAEMVTETEKDYMRALDIPLPRLPLVPESPSLYNIENEEPLR